LQGQAEVERDKLTAEKLNTLRQAEKLTQAELKTKQVIEQTRQEVAEATAQAELQAMKQVVLEQARAQMAEMVNPYEQMLNHLRGELFQAALEIAASLHRHGFLHSKVAEKARNLVAYCQVMNTHNDHDLETLLTQLQRNLPATGGEKGLQTVEALDQTLTEIITFTREAAQAVGHYDEAQDYGFGNLDI
jgi:uncharacterized protein YbgA (DUF1722 family)